MGYLTFSDRTPVITQDQSRALVTGLQKIGLVDAAGWLTANPAKNLVRGQGSSGRASGPDGLVLKRAVFPQASGAAPPTLPQRTGPPRFPQDKWTAQLQAALPWMSDTSGNNRTFDLGLHTSGLLQTLFVAYAKHEDVSGARGRG